MYAAYRGSHTCMHYTAFVGVAPKLIKKTNEKDPEFCKVFINIAGVIFSALGRLLLGAVGSMNYLKGLAYASRFRHGG
jgi:hypothetical protein